jgi:hypothetical protein
MVSEQPAVLQERLSQVGTMPNAAGCFARLPTNRLKILTNELGQIRPRQVAPEVLHGVEFRRVRRQILAREPRLLRDPGLNLRAAMGWQSVPQQDDLPTTHVSLQRLQIGHDLRLLDRPRLKPHNPTRRAAGVVIRLAMADKRFQLKGAIRIGVCPRGDQVRRTLGRSEKPLSSRKISNASVSRAFF